MTPTIITIISILLRLEDFFDFFIPVENLFFYINLCENLATAS